MSGRCSACAAPGATATAPATLARPDQGRASRTTIPTPRSPPSLLPPPRPSGRARPPPSGDHPMADADPTHDHVLNTELLNAELPDARFVDASYLHWLYDLN